VNRQPLVLIADRECAVEMLPDDDARLGVTAAMGAGEDLEDVLAESHGVVIGHGAFIREAADVIEVLLGGEGPIGGVRVGRGVGKARIVAGA